MIACIRLGTHEHQIAWFDSGWADLEPGQAGDLNSSSRRAGVISCRESAIGAGVLEHNAPTRQVVATLLLPPGVVQRAEGEGVPFRSPPLTSP